MPASVAIRLRGAMNASDGFYLIQPLTEPRWRKLVHSHPHSSVFHSPEWLGALKQAYGYEVLAFTTSPPDSELQNAIVFCEIDSWLTGRRLVSLPFSDHCDPLVTDEFQFRTLVSAARSFCSSSSMRYIELRPERCPRDLGMSEDLTSYYCRHHIDLGRSVDEIFKTFHENSTKRKIRRAEREGLQYCEGRSNHFLDVFYGLHLMTRRRQRTLPHPRSWFRSLIDHFGEALKIRVAFQNREAIAAILTLQCGGTMVYKYGCSDARFHRLGGVHLLFWQAIQDAKREGMSRFDLGRSEWSHNGLITFKDRWGAVRSDLHYLRFSGRCKTSEAFVPEAQRPYRVVRHLIGHLPDLVLAASAELAVRHLA